MDKDNDPTKPSSGSRKPAENDFDDDDSGITPTGNRRREPIFSDFNEEDGYEEPDRDTDYAAAYEEEEIEGDDLDDLEPAEAGSAGVASWELASTGREWQEPETSRAAERFDDELEEDDQDDAGREEDDYDDDEDWDDEDNENQPDDDDWEDPDQEDDVVMEEELEEEHHGWPLGLIAVALVALLLLAAGGYGVIQQRSAMQEEILELQASLATAASPADVAASREALREMEQRSRDQAAEIRVMNQENSRLSDMVASLEVQLKAQQAATVTPAKPAPKPTPKPVAAKPATKAPAASSSPASTAVSGGGWFVNFGSFNSRAVAQERAKSLKPAAGKVVVSSASKGSDTFYRVRVVGLGTRDQAERISRQLEAEFGLPKLWVGLE